MIDIKSLMNTLESNPDNFSEVVKFAKKELIPCLQKISDVYIESTKGKKRGSSDYATNMLIAKAINDLICGIHLANHGYISQSYAVLRPILETVDLLSLFDSQPQCADKWANGGIEAWKELSPTKVRELLGDAMFDPVYSHFCEAGAHSTFRSGTSMTAMKLNGNQRSVTVWIGGAHNEFIEPQTIFLYGFIFLLIFKVYSKALGLLHKQQGKDLLNTFPELISHFENFINFSKDRLIKRGVDTSELSEFLNISKSFAIFK
jgi:hypothetical protein